MMMLKPKACITSPRDSILKLKSQGLAKLVVGLLETTKLKTMPVIRQFDKYLLEQGLRPNDDKAVLAWLQEHRGPLVGAILFTDGHGQVDFLLTTGTTDELRKIGDRHGKNSNNS